MKCDCQYKFPYTCKCKEKIKIKNPVDPSKLKQESELGEQLKSGHTVRRINGKSHNRR